MYYYRNKETGVEKIRYVRISNGVVLTSFNDKGIAISNPEMQMYISSESLEQDWEEFVFSPKVNLAEEEEVMMRTVMRELLYQMNNHGAMFQEDISYNDWQHLDGEYDLVKRMLKTDFNLYGGFEDWYRNNVSNQLTQEDDMEYGYNLEGTLSHVKVIIDNMKILAMHYKKLLDKPVSPEG